MRKKGLFMTISIIVGTRPEIIKMAPIIHECSARELDFFILHTGQHYSYNMDKVFFEQLQIPETKYQLDIGSGSHGVQTGKMIIEIEKVLEKEMPEVVLVEGDTNTVLAGAIAAVKLGVPVGHVEAGLRSYDRTMPEEINRILTDHCSRYLFAPTEKSKAILRREGIADEKIFVTGNTIVDVVFSNLELSREMSILEDNGVIPQGYFLVTLHRQENVDNISRFTSIIAGLREVASKHKQPVVYPIHPRSRKMLETFDIDVQGIHFIDPVDFRSFLKLEENAKLILTDSGGVQEEACILKVPCVTLRNNTERPETVDVGSNILVGAGSNDIVDGVDRMIASERTWMNPFGDGTAAKKILDILARLTVA